MYQPDPIDTSHIHLPAEFLELTEKLASNTHDVWAKQRLEDGWVYGPRRDDNKKEHPSLVPYDELPESEKKYDRTTALEVIKVIIALGFTFSKDSDDTQGDR